MDIVKGFKPERWMDDNTTAAIGKGFAIGSAALVSLALFGAFVTRIRHSSGDALFQDGVNMLEPVTFAFLIIGGMIPFAFAAMTMKSVGVAAMEMVMEVQRQFDEKPSLQNLSFSIIVSKYTNKYRYEYPPLLSEWYRCARSIT